MGLFNGAIIFTTVLCCLGVSDDDSESAILRKLAKKTCNGMNTEKVCHLSLKLRHRGGKYGAGKHVHVNQWTNLHSAAYRMHPHKDADRKGEPNERRKEGLQEHGRSFLAKENE